MYENQMKPAFAGMKADAGFDRVETFAAAGALAFGVAVSETAGKVAAGNTTVRGVSVHSHTVTGAGYQECDAVSVMTRGLVWMRCIDAVNGSAVKIGADGVASAATGATLKNAAFRSDAVDVDGGKIAIVELHNPNI